MAGLFEEVPRVLILRTGLVRKELPRRPLAFGLGWGLTEALIAYALPAGAYAAALGYGWLDLMPGALERNAATAVHVSLSLLLSRDPQSFRLLAAAAALLLLESVWLVELVLATLATTLLAVVAMPALRHLRRAGGEQQESVSWG